MIRDPTEQWLYFFRRAKTSTASELLAKLADPVFAEAVGVLEMIAQNPEERRFYNERLKVERDQRARLLQAREDGLEIGRVEGIEEGLEKGMERGMEEGLERGRAEGLEKGIEVGALLGRIQLLQSLVGDNPASDQELLRLGRERLMLLEHELQHRLRLR